MQPLTTFEFTEPLVGTIDQQRRQRRAALRKFVKDQLLIHDLRQVLAEERALREMVEAENESLRHDMQQGDSYIVRHNHDGTWTTVETMTVARLIEDMQRENAELRQQNAKLERKLTISEELAEQHLLCIDAQAEEVAELRATLTEKRGAA